jgi:hypothetical protein
MGRAELKGNYNLKKKHECKCKQEFKNKMDWYYVLKQQFSRRKFGRRKPTGDRKFNRWISLILIINFDYQISFPISQPIFITWIDYWFSLPDLIIIWFRLLIKIFKW